jgi:pyridoxamine 5'-phosphate oxidase
MDLQEYLKFANENTLCSVATVDGDQPHVRTVRLERADETGFYFTLVRSKKMYSQVCANPKVEICFFNHNTDPSQTRQMRLTGLLEEIDDPEMLEKAYYSRKILEQNLGKPLKPLLAIFRLSHGDLHFWTFANALREESIEHVTF